MPGKKLHQSGQDRNSAAFDSTAHQIQTYISSTVLNACGQSRKRSTPYDKFPLSLVVVTPWQPTQLLCDTGTVNAHWAGPIAAAAAAQVP